MTQAPRNPSLPVQDPPAPDAELAPLLSEPFARAWQAEPPAGQTLAWRDKLLARVAAGRRTEAAMVTQRRARVPRRALAPGVTQQVLYRAAGPALRPGEPLRASLVELAPGARLDPRALPVDDALRGCHREWLVMRGDADLGTVALSQRDYHVVPAGAAAAAWSSATGALLFLRESRLPARAGDTAHTLFDAEAGWADFAPGLRRRVLWARDGQAALLYHAEPGVRVPHHGHGHDEECLMLQGELFLDDLLLQAGDYQLAPTGTAHRLTETDVGAVIYAHGDLDLQFVN